MNLTAQVKGILAASSAIVQNMKQYEADGKVIIKETLEKILKQAQSNAPKVTGALSQSGHIEIEKNGLSGKVIFGGPVVVSGNAIVVDYAIYVHEIVGGAGYKFLENAAEQEIPEFLKKIDNMSMKGGKGEANTSYHANPHTGDTGRSLV